MDAVMDRDTLAAFVDGALSPEDSARVVLHLADHPGDSAHVDALMELNALLGQAFAAPLTQPAPERIVATILGTAGGAPARTNAPRRGLGRIPGWRPVAGRAGGRRGFAAAAVAAAAVALVVGLAFGPGPMRRPVQILAAPSSADADLRAALETAPSGAVATAGPYQITLLGTFLDKTGRPCREYNLLDPIANTMTQGVACRSGVGEWSTAVAVASRLAGGVDRDAFVPASGEPGDPEALDRALDMLGAGMAMTPAEEQALLDGWR